MNTRELTYAVTRLGVDNFGGVKASDELPDKKVSSLFYIVNTDPSYKNGAHWIVFYMGSVPEAFDSLGSNPKVYDINFENFLVNNGPNYMHSSCRIQDNGTNTCGKFCLFYI